MYRKNPNIYNYMQTNTNGYYTMTDPVQQNVYNKGLKNEKIQFDNFICTILDIVASEKQYCENNCDINQEIIFDKFNTFLKNTLKSSYNKNILDDINIVISYSNKLFEEKIFDKLEDVLFLSCILYCIKDNYDQLTDENKQIYIMHFLKKIQFELENKSEYRLYFDYSSLLNDVKEYNISINLIKFICLYLNINLVILDGTNEKDNKYNIYFFYDNIKPGKEFKINIVLYKFRDLSIEDKNNVSYFVVSYCNIKLWNSETFLLKMILKSDVCEHMSTNKIEDSNITSSLEKKTRKNKINEKTKICEQKDDNKDDVVIVKSTNENDINDTKPDANITNKKEKSKTLKKDISDDELSDNDIKKIDDDISVDENETPEDILCKELSTEKKTNKKTKQKSVVDSEKKKYNKIVLNKMTLQEIITIANKCNISPYLGKTKKGDDKTKKKSVLIDEILNVQ